MLSDKKPIISIPLQQAFECICNVYCLSPYSFSKVLLAALQIRPCPSLQRFDLDLEFMNNFYYLAICSTRTNGP
jgi:hypothetical protein